MTRDVLYLAGMADIVQASVVLASARPCLTSETLTIK